MGKLYQGKQSGFTIVELLIVIVVIGILAAITVIAYNGIQQRAKNASMAATVGAYVKAILSYLTAYVSFPEHTACLGQRYAYGFSGIEETDINGQCQSANKIRENSTFNNQIKEFTNGALPSPPMDTIGTSTNWNRGIHFNNWSGYGGYYIGFVMVGDTGCPSIGGLTMWGAGAAQTNGRVCVGTFPSQ